MSAFAVLYDRLGSPLEPGLLERVMERLSHRGPDGQDVFVSGPLAMGHWHFWTTPEEVDEHQPLKVDGLPFRLVFDGRLDNRADLFAALSISAEEGCLLSDAALVLRAYAAWGERCVEHFIGEFAIVLFDERAHTLFCARDHLGDRTLFYAQQGSRVVIASEPWAILALPEFVAQADDVAAAHFFSFRAPQDGRTLFKDVFELLPGCQFSIKNGNLTAPSPYWQPDPTRTIRYKSDDEYAEHFLSLMDEAVRCRMRGSTQPAILMSGGLDSTTIASLAARQIAPRQLSTYSYVFDQFHDCDEREYIHSVKEKYNTRSVEINCDDLWPFYNWPEWLLYPNYPISNFYWPLRQRVYRQAHQDGVRILLNGDFGDHLYYDDAGWLADLFFDGQIAQVLREFRYHLSSEKLRGYFFQIPFRRFARRVLSLLPGGAVIRRTPTQVGKPWLTQACRNIFSEQKEGLFSSCFDTLFDLYSSQLSPMDPFATTSSVFELRKPCRDFRLVQFMTEIPSSQLYQLGVRRHILRNAMRGILPEKVRARRNKTGLYSMYFYGVQQQGESLGQFFQETFPLWGQYVDKQWLLDRWNLVFDSGQDGAEKVVPWLCLAYTIWCKKFILS